MTNYAKRRRGILLFLLLFSSTSFSTTVYAWDDLTETILANYQQGGLEELGNFEAGGVDVRFALTSEARQIISSRAFDKPDPAFNETNFLTFVRDTWQSGLDYFHVLVPTLPFEEVNIVLHDLKEERKKTICYTGVNSRVITMDLRRWHKLYLGFSPFLGALTSIHEFTHVNNYWLDEGEEKLHREQVAIVFEVLNLVKIKGMDWFLANYLKNVAGTVVNPQDLLATDYKGMVPLRTLVHGLIKRIWNGTYKVSGDKLEAIEAWTAAYLADRGKGDSGLNSSLVSAKVKTTNGSSLTALRWRTDVYQELVPVQ